MTVQVTHEGYIATLTISGPAAREPVLEALAGVEPGVTRAVLLNATASANLQDWTGSDGRWLWRDFPLPIVFAFEGAIAGALAALALSCDIRICGDAASLELPAELDSLTRNRLRTLLRLEPDRELPSAPRWAPADALKRGLVSRVATPGEAGAAARALAETIASRGPIATHLAKEAVWRGLSQPLEQALRFETDLTLLLQATKDRAEGVRAFLEKRPPEFTGE